MIQGKWWMTAMMGAVAGVALLAARPPAARAEAGDVLVRVRGLYVLAPNDKSTALRPSVVRVKDDVVPEIDFSVFLTDNLALELIAATTRHRVNLRSAGQPDVGLSKVSLLPPTLTLQYHLPLKNGFKPYAGVGVNYTIFYDSKLLPGAPLAEIHYKDRFGWALQAGFDYTLGDSPWFVNADVKRIFLKTKVKTTGGALVTPVNIDPWIFGLGIGYRF